MDRTTYLASPHIASFLAWVRPLIGGPRRLAHSWSSPRWGHWSCESLFDAYQRFDWPFSVTIPGASRPTRGRSFEENAAALEQLSLLLRKSVACGDAGQFLSAAIAVMEWGSVRGVRRLEALGSTALPIIQMAAEQLEPASADTERLDAVRHMNSGFSKIYSLLLKGFPIYDSRVASALGSLVQAYCKEAGLQTVPVALAFGLPPSQGRANRDPSDGLLRFRPLWYGAPRQYAISNLMAAWLLGVLAHHGPFGELPAERGLLALESALFMIGYARVESGAIR